MRIVVDTNIIFSSLLNPSGKISDLLINSNDFFKFFAPDFAVTELQKHNSKLLKTSGYTQEELNFLMRMIFKKVELVDLNILSKESKTEAIQITASIDKYDAPFIALCLELNAPLWTGDKKLINGLISEQKPQILNTQNMMELRDTL